MEHHVFPAWAGKMLLAPYRRILENPEGMFAPHVREGMTVLEPGCAMGFFTLPLAEMVGPSGRVVVLEVQRAMLDGLEKRAKKAGLAERIDMRLVNGDDYGLQDLEEQVDFSAVINMAHETPDQDRFFEAIGGAMKAGGVVLFHEPKWHVSKERFRAQLECAQRAGLFIEPGSMDPGSRRVVLRRYDEWGADNDEANTAY